MDCNNKTTTFAPKLKTQKSSNMKKVILVAAIAAFGFAAQAQTTYGPKAGVNISSLRGDDADGLKSLVGFHFGGFVNLPIAESLQVQPEVLFSTGGAKEGDVKLNMSYISIPVMVKYATTSGFFGEVGPQIGFLMSAKAKSGSESEDIKEYFKKTDFGAAIGLGYEHTSGFGGNVRYTLGLSNIGEAEGSDMKTGIFAIGLFYKLGKTAKK